MFSIRSFNLFSIHLLPGCLLGLSLLSGCSDTSPGDGFNPGIEETALVYAKRTIQVDDNNGSFIQPDIREPLESSPGGDVFLKPRFSLTADAINITQSVTNGQGDVRDISVSHDGRKIVFSLLPEDPNPNDNDDPKWSIYTYDIETASLNRVIASNIVNDEGDDIAPHFLPDGRIVFSSNRQSRSRSILLDETLSKPQFSYVDENRSTKALVLHTMDADGTNIKQISFNQSHDLGNSVLDDGRILFSRWDHFHNEDRMSLYTIAPDGTGLQPYFGTHDESHRDADGNTIHFILPRELPNGEIMAITRPYDDTFGGGDLVIIDARNFIDLNQTTFSNIGAFSTPAIRKATLTDINNDGELSLQGRYADFFPLRDNSDRVLVSKGICQVDIDIGNTPNTPLLETHPCIEPYLSDATAVESYPSFGIWIYDLNAHTEKPLVIAEPGKYLTSPVAVQPKNRPTILVDKTVDQTLESENLGLLKIRSVYDFGDQVFDNCFFSVCSDASVTSVMDYADPAIANASQRPARFIRIVKAAGIPLRNDPDLADPPDISNRAFGPNTRLRMKEIIGYSMIQPDGSVAIKVPADVAFYFDILDDQGRKINPRHNNWLQVKPGDTLECTGCHTHSVTAPELPVAHARADAEAPSINPGAPNDGFIYTDTQNPATLAPYFADTGDTMAEAISRAEASQNNDSSITPSVNLVYSDLWTDPAVRMPDASYSFTYRGITDGLTTPAPTTAACETEWSPNCRTVINYQEHIQPIWEVDRGANTCTSCHNSKDSMNATMLPAAQLDLSSEVSDEEAQHIESYRELMFSDNFQDLIGGALVDRTISVPALDGNGEPILDIDGNPTFEDIPDPALRLSPSVRPTGARNSPFMEKLTETELDAGASLSPATVNHANMLTPAELRLISEWIDIGAQYFNNPFDPLVPEN